MAKEFYDTHHYTYRKNRAGRYVIYINFVRAGKIFAVYRATRGIMLDSQEAAQTTIDDMNLNAKETDRLIPSKEKTL